MIAEIHQLKPKPGPTAWMCSSCGIDAACNCGAPLMSKSQRAAEAIAANPQKSNRAIAEEIGADEKTVRKARVGADWSAPDDEEQERVGRDGKSYSVRQRITDDPDIPQEWADEAAATGRRRVFLRCAEDAVRKAEQGAGLKDAIQSEIDDEILMSLNRVIEAWTSLRDDIMNRTGE